MPKINWSTFIKEVDDIFNTKLDKACYSNFKDVYQHTRFYNSKDRFNSNLAHNNKIKNTLLFDDMSKRICFDEDLQTISFTNKLVLIQNNIISRPICICGNSIKYTNSSNGLYNVGCSLSCIQRNPNTRDKHVQSCILKYGESNASRCITVKEKRKKTIQDRYNVDYASQVPSIANRISQSLIITHQERGEEIYQKTKQTNLERWGVEYPMQSAEVQEKIKQTNLERYGFENPMQSDEIQEKAKQTNLERYGFENPMQSDEIQEKAKQTNIERYGFEYSSQSKEVQEKIKQTNLERYGFKNPWQSKEVQEKIKQTNLERYGFEYSFQSKEVQEKAKQTNLERYGFEYSFQSKEVQEKIKQTNLERYGFEYVSQCQEIQDKMRITYLENNLDSIWDNIVSNTHCRPLFRKDEYTDARQTTIYNWECVNCNLQYESYYYSGRVKVCPVCTKSRSLGEIELYNYIQSLIPDVEVIANDYSVIPPKEIDIYIPSMKVAFEYNGDYWHGLKEDGYHEGKTSGCEAKDIRLYHILESEWKGNNNEVKNLIKSVLCRL